MRPSSDYELRYYEDSEDIENCACCGAGVPTRMVSWYKPDVMTEPSRAVCFICELTGVSRDADSSRPNWGQRTGELHQVRQDIALIGNYLAQLIEAEKGE